MRALFLLPLLSLVACQDSKLDHDDDDGGGLNVVPQYPPDSDNDDDGYTYAEEMEYGSDPQDADDVPYSGGWVKGDCRYDIQPTGNSVGDVAENLGLTDQFGDVVYLHDFCDRVVVLEYSAFS